MLSQRVRAAAIRTGLAALTVIATSVTPPPENPTPTQCLDAWDRDPYEISYHGDGWPGALVAGPPARWLYYPLDFFDDTDRDFSLYCGDEQSGVVHIAAEMGSGTGHPISESDEGYFIGCWNLVIGRGTATDEGDGRTRFDLTIRGRKSRAFVDNARRFTYSLYTTDDDWRACYLAWVTEY